MSNLIVRNIDAAIVKSLKARAGLEGISAEALHRKLLEEALLQPNKKSFIEALQSIPPVGKDSDFERVSFNEDSDVFN